MIINDLFGFINSTNSTLDPTAVATVSSCSITPSQIAGIVALVDSHTITTKMARRLLKIVYDKNDPSGDVRQIVEEERMVKISGAKELAKIAENVVADGTHLKQIEQYGCGDARDKRRIIKFFVGKVMKETKGMADIDVLEGVLEEVVERALK